MLVSEQNQEPGGQEDLPQVATVNLHLDKSHICAHTYPEWLDPAGICTFRVDIDVATCGSISPLRAIGPILEHFDSDVVHIHYAVRGYARAPDGSKIFLDHAMNGLADLLPEDIKRIYELQETQHTAARSYHAALRRRVLEADSYFRDPTQVPPGIKKDKLGLISAEIDSIAQGLP